MTQHTSQHASQGDGQTLQLHTDDTFDFLRGIGFAVDGRGRRWTLWTALLEAAETDVAALLDDVPQQFAFDALLEWAREAYAHESVARTLATLNTDQAVTLLDVLAEGQEGAW